MIEGGTVPVSAPVHSGNAGMFWSMAYKVSDALMLLACDGALSRLTAQGASAATLAKDLGWHAAPLGKVLDLLVRAGVLEMEGANYLVPTSTAAVLPLIVMEAQVRQWHAGNESLRKMVQDAVASDPLGQIEQDSYLGNYQGAMAASARALALHLFRHGGIPRAGRILDLGGADGALAQQLGLLMPETTFCVIDRPPVAPHFQQRMRALPAPGRYRFVADDLTRPEALAAEAAKADVVIISNLLHLLDEGQIRALLTALKATLPNGCRVLVYDQFVAPDKFDAASLMVVDWVNLGSLFDLDESDMAQLFETLGYCNVSARRFPLLPGALVCASAS